MTEDSTVKKKNDRMMKVLSVVVAVMLWFYANAEQNPMIERHFDIPIQYVNQSDDEVILNEEQTVRINIRGKQTDLAALRGDDFTAVVDLKNAAIGDGDYEVKVTASNVQERFTYTPGRIHLEIEELQTKEVPVNIRTTDNLDTGYELISKTVTPETVTIKGSLQVLENISSVETDVISLAGLTEDVTRQVGLQLPDNVAVQGKEVVSVHFLVQSSKENAHYETALELRNVPDMMKATASTANVTIQLHGSAELLKKQEERNKIHCYIDCSNMGEGQHTATVQVDYTGNLEIVQVEPVSVTVMLVADSGGNIQPTQTDETQNTTSETDTNAEGELN